MSWRLKRSVMVLVRAALAAAVLALFPTVAEAQGTSSLGTSSVVVRPGDTLWSISSERLGQSVTTQQIVNSVEQIYALNQNRIGADPNLIFVGQELLVSPTMSERSTGGGTGGSTRTTTAQKVTEAAGVDSRGRAAKSTTDKALRTALGRAVAKGGEVPEPVAKPGTKPETFPDTAAARVPAVELLASNDSPPSPVTSFLRTVRSAVASAASVVTGYFAETFAEPRTDGRRLPGLEIIVLILLVAALMAWRLPMRRTTRWDAEVWGMPTGYYGSAAYRMAPFSYHPGSPGDRDKQDARWQVPGSLGYERRAVLTGSGNTSDTPAASGIRNVVATVGPVSILRAKAVPRNGLALGAHNPEVRRASLRARAQMTARNPRLRRGASILGRNRWRDWGEPEMARLGLEARS